MQQYSIYGSASLVAGPLSPAMNTSYPSGRISTACTPWRDMPAADRDMTCALASLCLQ